jgi:hypothetical protein
MDSPSKQLSQRNVRSSSSVRLAAISTRSHRAVLRGRDETAASLQASSLRSLWRTIRHGDASLVGQQVLQEDVQERLPPRKSPHPARLGYPPFAPHLRQRGTVRRVRDETIGAFDITGLPVKFSRWAERSEIAADRLGEHNEEVLRELLCLSDKGSRSASRAIRRPAVTTDEDLRYDVSDRIAEISLARPPVKSQFRPISRLEAKNAAALRRQLMVLQRQVRGRVQFTNSDREEKAIHASPPAPHCRKRSHVRSSRASDRLRRPPPD